MDKKTRKLDEFMNHNNAEICVFAFKNHIHNAKAIIKQELLCNDEEFKQIESNYHFNGLASWYVKPKVKAKRTGKEIKRLKEREILVDKENLSIAIPIGIVFTEQDNLDINKLVGYGYLCQNQTYKLF